MSNTVKLSLQQFEETLCGRTQRPPQPPKRAVDTAQAEFRKHFFTKAGRRRTGAPPSVNDIAKTMVSKVINKISLPNNIRGSLSQSRHKRDDPTSYKVHAGLYSRDVLPKGTRADWSCLRLFLQFEEGGAEHDPFDDGTAGPPDDSIAPHVVRGQARVLKRLTKAAYKTFNYQHRTFVCALLINGSEFRAMLWDHVNLYVSDAADYAENPSALIHVLWSFASLDNVGQGIDPTAVRVLPGSREHARMDLWARENAALDMPYEEDEDVTRFYTPHNDNNEASPSMHTRSKTDVPTRPVMEYVRAAFRDSLAAPWWPRYKLRVGPEGREFLVGKPVFMANGMFGRGTRGFVALDAKEERFVFLKDAWRLSCEGVEAEGVFLEEMAAGSADPDVTLEMVMPTVVAHGDIVEQTTRVVYPEVDSQADELLSDGSSSEDAKLSGSHASGTTAHNTASSNGSYAHASEEEESEESNKGQMQRRLVHYRIAVNEVCMKMSSFKNGKQLVRLIMDCMKTHRDAYNHFDLLHRDISSGNVLIIPVVMGIDGKKVVVWKGLLTDWELAKRIPKDRSVNYRPNGWVGTFQFTSVAHVHHPDVPKQIADELESFFHVLMYHGVRYLRHDLRNPSSFIMRFYDTYGTNSGGGRSGRAGIGYCSMEKVHAMTFGHIGFRFQNDDPVGGEQTTEHPLYHVLHHDMMPLFAARYAVLDWTDDQRRRATEDGCAEEAEGPEPSAEIKATAALLETHDTLLERLQTTLDGCAWPLADKAGDQLALKKDVSRRAFSLRSVHCEDAPTKRRAKTENMPAAAKRPKVADENSTVTVGPVVPRVNGRRPPLKDLQ
ncbi:hypothetical protein BD413DRAFT_680533 [Trametes elegans]|nr:hypothetical protein BD413DRAFT_680533 [Trametes elegans]